MSEKAVRMSEKTEKRNQKSGQPIGSFADLHIFQRAYAVSFEVQPAFLGWLKTEQSDVCS